jgi:uncharacterized protein YraI
MMGKKIYAACLALAILCTTAAQGVAHSYASGDVNMRVGPGKGYARIATVPKGAPLHVHGCTASRWCDVTFGYTRGWVFGRFIGASPYGVALAPQVVFVRMPVVHYPHYRPRPVVVVPAAPYWGHEMPIAHPGHSVAAGGYVVGGVVSYGRHPEVMYTHPGHAWMW